jgi:hypothetical protein
VGSGVRGSRVAGSHSSLGQAHLMRCHQMLDRVMGIFENTYLPRTWVNKEEASCFSRACLAQRSCPSRDRLCSSLELSPDRPMALPTAPAVIAPAAPQITPITTPRATSPVHHHTPRLTTNDTTKNTTVDNITMAAILVRILHPIVCVRCSVMRPTLFALQSGHSEITALQRCRRSSTTLGRRPRAVCSPAPLAGWSR